MQRNEYERDAHIMAIENHAFHNENPDYWDILLGDIKREPEKWKDKTALDFGCGCGRNVYNMLTLADWKRVDGIDISFNNINNADTFLHNSGELKFALYTNNGVDVSDLEDDEYDFIMSTIVFQHICVYDIRFSLLKDLYRVLKPGGTFSVQFPLGPGHIRCASYYENFYEAPGTNSFYDVRVDSTDQIEGDLKLIGFKDISFTVSHPWSDDHANWVYVKATK